MVVNIQYARDADLKISPTGEIVGKLRKLIAPGFKIEEGIRLVMVEIRNTVVAEEGIRGTNADLADTGAFKDINVNSAGCIAPSRTGIEKLFFILSSLL